MNYCQRIFFYSKIPSVNDITIVFINLSKNNDFPEQIEVNFLITDDKQNTILEKTNLPLHGHAGVDAVFRNGYYCKVYYYDVSESELTLDQLYGYKTKYLMLDYEINGIKYSERLIRNERTYYGINGVYLESI